MKWPFGIGRIIGVCRSITVRYVLFYTAATILYCITVVAIGRSQLLCFYSVPPITETLLGLFAVTGLHNELWGRFYEYGWVGLV